MELYDHQREAVEKMHNGCILCGWTGSGKSFTGLAYYQKVAKDKDLYIITTAKNRDDKKWLLDCAPLGIEPKMVDSWNNIKKYVGVTNAFFIFDEQRVVGYGTWTKSFLKITKTNEWIMLSATPGDVWTDYIPVFIANGFYRNKTEFEMEHCVFNPYVTYRQVKNYLNVTKLNRLRDKILVDMDYIRRAEVVHNDIWVGYDKELYKSVMKNRWDPFKDKPIGNISELCYLLRKIINSDIEREEAMYELIKEHPRCIIFYNFDYELDILRGIHSEFSDYEIGEWNGHFHQDVPTGEKWVYLVQYNAGAEGWNCIKTDTIVFFSQTYSYKTLMQACGRIDRLNSPFIKLYYYHLKSKAPIDLAINAALKNKKKFNERRFVG